MFSDNFTVAHFVSIGIDYSVKMKDDTAIVTTSEGAALQEFSKHDYITNQLDALHYVIGVLEKDLRDELQGESK